jgi:hypothetical protein
VSGSAVTILVPGRSALTALAIPVVSPPPPYGITITSGSGRSSSISSPIVPLPAITAGSWTGCTNSPSTPSTRLATIAFHQSSYVILMTRPPSRSIAAILASGAWSGTAIVAGTPSSRAVHATPCAMFPALAVTSPLTRALAGASMTALVAPRILNELIGCRFSSLR